MTNTLKPIKQSDLPALGQEIEGATLAGIYWLDGHLRTLELLPDELEGEWGKYGQDVPGARSFVDGEANTRAMVEAGSALAAKVMELGGFIPSCMQGHLLMEAKANGQITLREDRYHWLSTQYSAYNAFSMGFEDGWQSTYGKLYERLVRPVRSRIIQ